MVQNISAKIVELILSQILEEDNFEFHINILQLFILRTLRSGKYLFIVNFKYFHVLGFVFMTLFVANRSLQNHTFP